MFAAHGIERFFFKPADPTALGLMRIATGVLILYVHLVYCIGLSDYLGPNAWVLNKAWTDKPGESGVTDFLRHGNPIQGPSSNWKDGWLESDGEIIRGQMMWSIYYHVEDMRWVWVIHISILVSMLLFTLGLWTRVTSVLTWIGALMYIQRLPGLLFGMDTMTNLGLLYLMVAPSGAALSLDRWLAVPHKQQRLGDKYVPQPPQPLVSARFATRLIQINFCLIYFAAGTSKLLGALAPWSGQQPLLAQLLVCPVRCAGLCHVYQVAGVASLDVGGQRAPLEWWVRSFWNSVSPSWYGIAECAGSW